MKIWNTRTAVVLVAVSAIGLFSTLQVSALESSGVGALPANPRPDAPRSKSIFVHVAAQGSKLSDAVNVVNNTDKERRVSVYAVDSQASSDGAFACAQAADEKKAVGSWVTLEQTEVTVPAHDTVKVPFEIQIPEKADVGEQNGCIVVQDTSTDAKQQSGGVVLNFRSAIRIAITIPGDLHAKLSLLEVSQHQSADGSAIVSPHYKNDGNISLDATIETSLVPLLGFGKSTKGGQFPALSHTEASFNFKHENLGWGGWYRRVVTTKYTPITTATVKDQVRSLPERSDIVFIAPTTDKLFIELLVFMLVGALAVYAIRYRANEKLLHSALSDYRIKKDDNIQTIAAAHAISWKKLAKLNQLKPPYTLKHGDTLRVPKASTDGNKTRRK